MKTAGRRGRPRSDDAATAVLKFRVRPQELDRFRLAARVNHQTLTDFARVALMGAVEDSLESSEADLPSHEKSRHVAS